MPLQTFGGKACGLVRIARDELEGRDAPSVVNEWRMEKPDDSSTVFDHCRPGVRSRPLPAAITPHVASGRNGGKVVVFVTLDGLSVWVDPRSCSLPNTLAARYISS